MQRGDQRGGGVAVEGASSLLEQLRLGVERGIPVELEQPGLDLHDLLGTAPARALLPQHPIGQVVVPKVRGGDGPERASDLERDLPVELVEVCAHRGVRVRGRAEQLRQSVNTVARSHVR